MNAAAIAAITQTIESGALAGDGAQTEACHAYIRQAVPSGRPFLTTSCTSALEMAVLLLDLGPGDEVIMPSWTFPSTANAVALKGATPVFVDVCRDTLNIDPRLVEAAITAKTRAILCVHYAGVSCDMDALGALAGRYRLALVEDAAQAFGTTWRGKPLGGFGDLGAFSFHATKNIGCGEGGALIVNKRDLVSAAEYAWEKGTNRLAYNRGDVEAYVWCTLGSSFLPSELTAAFLKGQLQDADRVNAARVRAWKRYDAHFDPQIDGTSLQLPRIPAEAGHNGHIYAVRLLNTAVRDRVAAYLKDRGIDVRAHYQSLHTSPAGRRYGRASGALPVTEAAAAGLLRLPIDSLISAEEQARVVETLRTGIQRHG